MLLQAVSHHLAHFLVKCTLLLIFGGGETFLFASVSLATRGNEQQIDIAHLGVGLCVPVPLFACQLAIARVECERVSLSVHASCLHFKGAALAMLLLTKMT